MYKMSRAYLYIGHMDAGTSPQLGERHKGLSGDICMVKNTFLWNDDKTRAHAPSPLTIGGRNLKDFIVWIFRYFDSVHLDRGEANMPE